MKIKCFPLLWSFLQPFATIFWMTRADKYCRLSIHAFFCWARSFLSSSINVRSLLTRTRLESSLRILLCSLVADMTRWRQTEKVILRCSCDLTIDWMKTAAENKIERNLSSIFPIAPRTKLWICWAAILRIEYFTNIWKAEERIWYYLQLRTLCSNMLAFFLSQAKRFHLLKSIFFRLEIVCEKNALSRLSCRCVWRYFLNVAE